jgi:hypothetical protein
VTRSPLVSAVPKASALRVTNARIDSMSVLTDRNLSDMITEDSATDGLDQLVISPCHEQSITPVGYDLRIGSKYSLSDQLGEKTIGWTNVSF